MNPVRFQFMILVFSFCAWTQTTIAKTAESNFGNWISVGAKYGGFLSFSESQQLDREEGEGYISRASQHSHGLIFDANYPLQVVSGEHLHIIQLGLEIDYLWPSDSPNNEHRETFSRFGQHLKLSMPFGWEEVFMVEPGLSLNRVRYMDSLNELTYRDLSLDLDIRLGAWYLSGRTPVASMGAKLKAKPQNAEAKVSPLGDIFHYKIGREMRLDKLAIRFYWELQSEQSGFEGTFKNKKTEHVQNDYGFIMGLRSVL